MESPSPDDVDVPQTNPQGAMTLMSPEGRAIGFVNAAELTAFRTALASTLLVRKRQKVTTITIFGAGRQAWWHLRLSLLLRGSTIKQVNIIVRNMNVRSRDLLSSLLSIPNEIKVAEGWSGTKFGVVGYSYGEFDRISKEQIRAADVIFCTTPSLKPLFDEKILTNTEGRRKGRLIIAVGSHKPDMIELPTELLHQATKTHGSGHHFHKHAEEGRVVIVDTIKSSLLEAGEIIQAALTEKQLVELGEIVMLETQAALDNDAEDLTSPTDSTNSSLKGSMKELNIASGKSSMSSVYRKDGGESQVGNESPSRSHSKSRFNPFSIHHHRNGSSSSLASMNTEKEPQDELTRWLSKGNVIYKSVGMGLMDLVVGTELVRMANEKGIGTFIKDF